MHETLHGRKIPCTTIHERFSALYCIHATTLQLNSHTGGVERSVGTQLFARSVLHYLDVLTIHTYICFSFANRHMGLRGSVLHVLQNNVLSRHTVIPE